MRKISARIILIIVVSLMLPVKIMAAGGIYASGGGSHVEGETFSVTVRASGSTFDAFQGKISVSGPVSVVSISAGSATWVKQPSNGNQFIGMVTSATSSLTVATVRLKGTQPGSGSVSVSGVSLAKNGSVVGTGAGGASFTITRAPVVPRAVNVTSSTHPDPTQVYEATTITLNWTKAAGVTGFSYLLDQASETALANKSGSANTTISYPDQKVGTYYFHIKALNGDGWGPTAHFKINIKEPDARIKNGLSKPINISISKTKNFKNNIKDGTVSGIKITGKIPPKALMEKMIAESAISVTPISIESSTKELYSANIFLNPEQIIADGKKLSATPDKEGNFQLVIDWPIHAGSYVLTAQGQRDKLLTPMSDAKYLQIEQKNGGRIVILSDKDTKEVIYKPTFLEKNGRDIKVAGIAFASAVIIYLILFMIKRVLRKPGGKNKKPTGFKWDE